jgi:glucokinase
MYYLGIDIGGMSIKVGVVDADGNILAKCADVTPLGDAQRAVDVMDRLCRQAAAAANVEWAEIDGVGAGAPGTVCDGVVTYATNLGWFGVPLAEMLTAATGKSAAVGNDANCALLAEWRLGAARGKDNVAMITLGTGIGTAFVTDGHLLLGNGAASGEGGHIRVKQLGKRCSCGREDCWELYASASSLLQRTEALIAAEPEGKCAAIARAKGKVDGFVLFDAIEAGDRSAAEVLTALQVDIADGLTNIANLLRPEVMVMGGGICAQDRLVAPLEEMVNARTLGGANNPHVSIVKPRFFNDAGIVGAAVQVMPCA